MPSEHFIPHYPAIVDLKEEFGDLGIDTIIGNNHKGTLVTINDRIISMVWILKFWGRRRFVVLKNIETLQPIKDLKHTISADNGKKNCKISGNSREFGNFFLFL